MSDKKQTLLEAINALVPNELKTAIKDLKAKFDAMPPMADPIPAPAPSNPIEVKLKDGTTLSVDKLEVGGIANLVSETGSVLAKDGEYVAEDGSTITILGGTGVISEIESPEAAAAEPAAMNQVTPEMLAALSARLATVETNFAASQTLNTALQTQLSSVNADQKVLLSAVEIILSASAGDPIEKPAAKNVKLNRLSNLGDSVNKK